LEKARTLKPDLVLLDLGLPDMDGLDLAGEVRARSRVPIIIISGRRGEQDMIRALDAGADDFLSKPFGSGELLARIRVALRHALDGAQAVLGGTSVLGPLQVNFDSREVTVYGHDVHLSPKEFLLVADRVPGSGVTGG
jgi:two-component system KDP operon response regulator KdpE